MKPLFLDEEWTRRRSERIFLNEPSPLPSPAITPPRESWKLANFMPKSKKLQDGSKSATEGDKGSTDFFKDQLPSLSLGPVKNSATFSTLLLSSSMAVKTEGKELTPSVSVSLRAGPSKIAEISTPKVEDAKMIVKLEDSATKPSLPSSSLVVPLLSPPEKARKSCKEKSSLEKKKTKEKIAKLTQSSTTSPSSPPPPTLEKKEKRAEQHSKIKFQKAKSLHELTQRVKKKYSIAGIRKQRDDQVR